MKNAIRVFGVIALVAVIAFTACSGGNPLENTVWEGIDGQNKTRVWSFGKTEFNSSSGNLSSSGTYTVDGDKVTTTRTSDGSQVVLTIRGNTIVSSSGHIYTKK